VFMDWLRSYRPDLVERYERLYARSAYAPREVQERMQRLARGGRGRAIRGLGGAVRTRAPAAPEAPRPRQQSLF
jgi:hypothetical protein